VIATLHAAADWLAEHPEVPAPHEVTMVERTTIADQPDDDERVGAVERWARANDARVTTTGRGAYFPVHDAVVASLPIVDRVAGRGVAITYRRVAMLPLSAS
jgi:hypothetical protein